jgi:hypothetical protein
MKLGGDEVNLCNVVFAPVASRARYSDMPEDGLGVASIRFEDNFAGDVMPSLDGEFCPIFYFLSTKRLSIRYTFSLSELYAAPQLSKMVAACCRLLRNGC